MESKNCIHKKNMYIIIVLNKAVMHQLFINLGLDLKFHKKLEIKL